MKLKHFYICLFLIFVFLMVIGCAGTAPNTPVLLLDGKKKGCVVKNDFYYQTYYVVALENGELVTANTLEFVELNGKCKLEEDFKL